MTLLHSSPWRHPTPAPELAFSPTYTHVCTCSAQTTHTRTLFAAPSSCLNQRQVGKDRLPSLGVTHTYLSGSEPAAHAPGHWVLGLCGLGRGQGLCSSSVGRGSSQGAQLALVRALAGPRGAGFPVTTLQCDCAGPFLLEHSLPAVVRKKGRGSGIRGVGLNLALAIKLAL